MDSDSEKIDNVSVDVIFENLDEVSSVDPPREEWSSLDINVTSYFNAKKILYDEGEYDPGSKDLCNKYIALSDSSVFRHPYYRYPPVLDPGILDALQLPEEVIKYPDDGQELYLAICKEMMLCPVLLFYKALLESEIDLKYYGVNPRGVRAMAIALINNNFVKTLRFTDNFLNNDACYHLGVMLSTNCTLTELDLSGCRIGHTGILRLLTKMRSNRTLKSLNVSKNELGDTSIRHLADAVFKGLNLSNINLSHNNISGKAIQLLVEAFETFNKFTHWNLSWNNLFTPGTYNFLVSLTETSKNLQEIDLSWNSLSGARIALGIQKLLKIKTLKHLNISNNKFEGEAILTILKTLPQAKKLMTLNLSNNPMSTTDAMLVLQKAKLDSVKVKKILMDNISVDELFLNMLSEIKHSKPNLLITYGYARRAFFSKGQDIRDLLLNRASYLCQKQRKQNKADIALVVLQIQKDKIDSLLDKDFVAILKNLQVPIDDDLAAAIINTFPGPRAGKGKTVDINLLVDYVRRKWPERQLPPTPPPEPEPEPEPIPKKGKNKVKGKK